MAKASTVQLDSVINLMPSECVLLEGDNRVGFRYNDAPDLRQDVREFVYQLVSEYRNQLAGECGRCGNSCRRPDVLVRHQELLAFQQHFGISENDFRQKYLEPAGTWNRGDGLIRLNEKGECPFLQVDKKNGEPDGAQSATCSVYDLRPQSCREYLSDKANCHKDVGQLIESLSIISLSKQAVTVTTLAGESLTLPAAPQWLESLSKKFELSRPNREQRFHKIQESLDSKLDKLIADFRFQEVDETYLQNVNTIRQLVTELGQLVDLAPGADQKIEMMWVKLRLLEAKINGEPGRDDAKDQEESAPDLVVQEFPWMLLRESSISCRDAQGQAQLRSLLGHPTLSAAVSDVVEAILLSADSSFQQALQEAEPLCYMCGECCRFYAVEIKPSDIRRLCQILPETPAEFVEKYTIPARFGWNKKARILKKVHSPSYSKGLTDLRVLNAAETTQCSFLERRDDGFFYCSVHSHKPQVCRNYGANNSLCRNVNQRENWQRQAHSLEFLEVDGRQIRVQTKERVAKNREALLFEVGDFADLPEALTALQKSLDSLV